MCSPLLSESALPVQALRGVYLGLLAGVVPALVALAVAIAGANGGLLALVDPSVTNSADAPTLTTALLVVMTLATYAHSHGDSLGSEFPRRVSLRALHERTLAPGEVVSLVARPDAIRKVEAAATEESTTPAE